FNLCLSTERLNLNNAAAGAKLLRRAIVVVPTYNEFANLQTLVERLRQFAPDLHVLIVADNSPDGTGSLADELSSKNPEGIFVLHRKRKEGLGKAYVDG